MQILRFPGTVDTGHYPKPRPFGGMGNPIDQTGFSDHFPIGMHVTEGARRRGPASHSSDLPVANG